MGDDITMSRVDAIEQYMGLRPKYVAFTERVVTLVNELLRINGIKAHLVEGRTKTIESFDEKIRRPGKSYSDPINELFDLSGIRVIVYYLKDVEKVLEVLSNEFKIIESETSHMVSEYSPDQFGYISMHIVVKIKPYRAKLSEWNAYESYPAEIQIRTVLQHSWAVVSHAMQYKHESDVPKQLRRKLYRLAGLFELADEEFASIRNKTDIIRNKASENLDRGNVQIPLNSISLSEFVQRWNFNEIKKFMQSIGYTFDPKIADVLNQDSLGNIIYHSEKLRINTIEDLASVINIDAKNFFQIINPKKSNWTVTVEFVLYLLLIRAKIDEFTLEDLVNVGWHESIAKRVINGAIKDKILANGSKERRRL